MKCCCFLEFYLVRFGHDPAFPPRCILFLVAVGLVPLIDVKVTVHFVLRVRVFPVVLIISRFLEENR